MVLIAALPVAALAAGAAVVVTTTALAAARLTATPAGIAFVAAGVLLGLGRLAAGQRQTGGFLLEVFRQRHRHQLDVGQAFDVLEVGLLVRRAEALRHAIGAGARGAADPVDILFRHVGQFEVEHVADPSHVDPARGDVGRHQHRRGALAEGQQRSGALGLALVAMDRRGIDAGGGQVAHDAVGAVLGAGEDQRAFDRAIGQASAQPQRQQRLLFALVDECDELIDALGRGGLRRHFNAHRVLDELLAQLGNCLRHGCAEEQALALLGKHVGHALQRHDEAQVHHLVGLVEHEDLDVAQRQRALVDQVEQAARGGDQDVAARDERTGLLADGDPAEHALDRKVQVLGIAAHVLGDLGGELAGGAQHQHPARGIAARLGVGGQAVQRGQ